MPSQEDIAQQQELLAAYRRTLNQYLKQRALISEPFTPPAIGHGIDDAREDIRRAKTTLRAWGVPVEDLPNDEEPPESAPARAATPRSLPRQLQTRRIALMIAGLLVLGAVGGLVAVLLPGMFVSEPVLGGQFEWYHCDTPAVPILPGMILPAQDPNGARAQLAQAIAARQIATWPAAGPDVAALISGSQAGDPRKLYVTVTGKGKGKINIHLLNSANITVSSQEIAAHVDVATIRPANNFDLCSGGGQGSNRTFQATELTSKSQQYTDDRQYTEAPFLTLNSEDSEVLVFPFECRDPGTYTIQITLRYRDNIRETDGTYTSGELPPIVCPSAFTYWPVTYSRDKTGSNPPTVQLGVPKQYYWNGTTYQEGVKP